MRIRTFARYLGIVFAVMVCTNTIRLVADGSQWYESTKHSFSIRVPNAYTCLQGRYDAEEYTSVDFFKREIEHPEVRNTDSILNVLSDGTTKALSDTCNALALRGPYGTYAVVFAAKNSFPSLSELQNRLLDQSIAESKSSGSSAQDLIQFALGEYTLSGLPATTLTIKRPVPNASTQRTDTLFTEIITTNVGTRVYGIIMRSYEFMGRESRTMMRQIFLSLVYGMSITLSPDDYTHHRIEGTPITCDFPAAWTKVFSKSAPFPVPVSDFSPEPGNLTKSEDSARRQSSVLIAQTPTFQCEFFVKEFPAFDSTTWEQTCTKIFDRLQPAAATDPINLYPVSLSHLKAYERSYSVFRRNDNVRTTWIAFHLQSHLVLVRIVAWERELTAIKPVYDIIARCAIAR